MNRPARRLRAGLVAGVIGLALLALGPSMASASPEQDAGVSAEPGPPGQQGRCSGDYRQLAFSPPLQGTTDGDEGFPWRFLYGFCLARFGRISLHQDLVLSYLDAADRRGREGGDGFSMGTDLSFVASLPGRGSLSPYVDLGGGIQFAARTAFPADGSRWMFTLNASAGLLVPLASGRQMTIALRHLHISNARVWPDNAGYDALHLLFGIRW